MDTSKKTFLWVGLLAVVLGIFYDVALRTPQYGLNVSLLVLFWLGIHCIFAWRYRAVTPGFLLDAGLTVLTAGLIFVRASFLVQFWLTLIALVLLTLLTMRLAVVNFGKLSLVQRYRALATQIFKALQVGPSQLRKSLQMNKFGQTRVSPGILIAVVLTIVFLILFASADQIVGRWFSHLGNVFNWLADIVGLGFPGHVFTAVFWGIVSFFILTTLFVRSAVAEKAAPQFRRYLSAKDARLVLGTLVTIFAIFVVIQLRYLFSEGALPNGLSYASYARQGYGQLLVATLLASTVVKYILSSVRTTYSMSERVLATVLVMLNAVIVLAAWKRLGLYESAYGWTMLRFVAHLGLITIGLGSIGLVGWVWQKLSSQSLYTAEWYVLCGVLLMAALLNPNGIVTARNIVDRPSRSVNLDTMYLSSLSADSWPSICRYAPMLSQTHPDEYKQLVAAQANHDHAPNLGLSRHYTHSKTYQSKYAACLQ